MLLPALSVSASGLQASSSSLNSISNNIANSNTPGYKAAQVAFQDLLYTSLRTGGEGATDGTLPDASQLGAGVLVSSTRGLFTQGSLIQTAGQFDLAINGQGFFRVTLRDGSTAFTRAGNFATDDNGRLVTSDGLPLADDVIVPAGSSDVSVGSDGIVTATDSVGITRTIGQLTLTRFQNVNGLDRVGDNLFVATPTTGAGVTGAPGTNGLGAVTAGSLEQSNVDLSAELTSLIVAQRAFGFNTRALETQNSLLQSTVDIFA